MTITVRITLPDLTPTPETKQLLRVLISLATPVLLSAADTSGIALPSRLLLHAAVNAAQHAAVANRA